MPTQAVWQSITDDVQILLTTHSQELVDALLEAAPPEHLPKFSLQIMEKDEAGRASFRRFDHEMIDAARRSLDEDLR